MLIVAILIFLSTPSARRATYEDEKPAALPNISIHALREEGDKGQASVYQHRKISIHALLAEGDYLLDLLSRMTNEFLSTPSSRRATVTALSEALHTKISIHALLAEGDL